MFSPSRSLRLNARQIIPHHLSVLHHEANALEFGDIGDRISTNGDEISELPVLNRAMSAPALSLVLREAARLP